MGYGFALKKILKEKNMSVRQLAIKCNIAPTTLYSIIQRDTDIRYDIALKISTVLSIPINSICNKFPCNSEIPLSNLLSNKTIEIIKLYNCEDNPILERLIQDFYTLDDEARNEIFKIISIKHETHNCYERVENIQRFTKKQ